MLTPLGNGRCRISNAGLGAELVLSVTGSTVRPVGTEWHTIEMASIDDSLPQEWTVTRVGEPPGNYDQVCRGDG